MPATPQRRHLIVTFWGLLTLTLGLVLAAGCGRQDLYEPPGSPYEVIGRLGLPAASTGVAVLERHAFVAGGEAGLHSIDWSDPTAPQLLATMTTVRTADDVQVVRTFIEHRLRDVAHVVEGTEGISSYDITAPGDLVDFNTGTTATFGRSSYIERREDPGQPYAVYMAEDWRGVRHFQSSVDEPGFLEYNGVVVRTQGRAYGVVVRDGWGYCAQNEMGLCVLDLRVLNPATVELVSWADTPGNARAVALAGDHAFIADGREGLAVFRIDGGETPVKIAQYVLNGFSVAIALRDDLVAVAANAAGVHFLDVSDPADPIYIGTTSTSFATGVAFSRDGYCLVADADEGLLVLGGRGPFRDTTPPWRITDLSTRRPSVMTMDLTWTMTGDDGMVGRADRVEVRVAEAPITDLEAWEAAAVAPGVADAGRPGEDATFTVTGLDPATDYHFAVRVHDRAGNVSGLSNPASAGTVAGIVLYDAGVDRQGGTDTDLFTFAVKAIYNQPFTVAEVVINGVPYPLEHTGGFLYRHQTTLPFGIYSYYFRFAAADAPEVVTDESDHERILVGSAFFTMGSPADEPGRGADEVLRSIVLSRELVAGTTEVTQAEWDAVMPVGSDPSVHLGDDRPVDSLTWFEAVAYCNARSLADGLEPAYTIAGAQVTWNREAGGWRLPTEAEWEYLNRAGAETALTNGPLTQLHCNLDSNLDAIAWYCGNAGPGPRPVAQKQPNALGLYDMSGNVREWCWDWYGELSAETVADPEGADSGYLRVCRGGSWHNASQQCRSAARAALPPDSADDTVGLRVVRTLFDD